MASFPSREEFKNKLREFDYRLVVIKASNFTIYSFLHTEHLYMEFQNSPVIGTEFYDRRSLSQSHRRSAAVRTQPRLSPPVA